MLRVPLPSVSSISFKDTPFLSTLTQPAPKHLKVSLPLPRDEYSSLLLTCILGHPSSVGRPWLFIHFHNICCGNTIRTPAEGNWGTEGWTTDLKYFGLSLGENQNNASPKSVPFLLNATLLISLFWSLDGTECFSLLLWHSSGKPAHHSLVATHKGGSL